MFKISMVRCTIMITLDSSENTLYVELDSTQIYRIFADRNIYPIYPNADMIQMESIVV